MKKSRAKGLQVRHSTRRTEGTNRKKRDAPTVSNAERLAKENETIANVGRIISSSLKIQEVYAAFAKEAKKLIPFDRVAVNLINHEEKTISTPYAAGIKIPGRNAGAILPLKNSINEKVIQTRSGLILQPANLHDLESQIPSLSVVYRAGFQSMMAVPLILGNKVIGTLQFRSKTRNAYDEVHLRIGDRIARQIVGAISGAQLFLKLKRAEETLRDSEKNLRSLSAYLLKIQETERMRLSRELHDEFGQELTLLRYQIGFIEKELFPKQKSTRELCKQAMGQIDKISDDIGRLSRGLRPPILDDLGLAIALRRLIDDYSKRFNIASILEIDDLSALSSGNAQLMVYRVFQEALRNIRKHSKAKTLIGTIKSKEDRICFSIADDGIGFLPGNVNKKGLGLAIMEERVRMIGGTMAIQSAPGQGTKISFIIPVTYEENAN